jgi:hypothetical protein
VTQELIGLAQECSRRVSPSRLRKILIVTWSPETFQSDTFRYIKHDWASGVNRLNADPVREAE